MGEQVSTLQFILGVIAYVFAAVTTMRLAKKAGMDDKAWWAWIPIMGTILLLKIAGKSGWWFLWFLVPIVNVVMFFIMMAALAKRFGHEGWVGVVTTLVGASLIYMAVLAFGDATYRPA